MRSTINPELLRLLPRRTRERLETLARDVSTVGRALLLGERPSPLVARPRPGTRTLPPPSPRSPASVPSRIVRITSVVRETEDAVSFYLEELDGRPIEFEPGQFLSVDVDIAFERLRRAYSLASAALPGHASHITVKRIDGGVVSSFLHANAETMRQLEVRGPAGTLTSSADERSLVLIAGGSGITPLISIAETKLERDEGAEAILIYGNRTESQIIFAERLDAMRRSFGPRLRLDLVLDEPPPSWPGGVGVLDDAVLSSRLDRHPDLADPRWSFLLCGPTAMMEAARRVLRGRGTPSGRIREERFQRPELREASTARHEDHRVVFRIGSDEHRVTIRGGDTLLEGGLAAGVGLPFSCAMGGCAACRLRLLEGNVEMAQPSCLTPSERDEGFVLACISRPASACLLELP